MEDVMGPCRDYCDQRCFVLRTLKDGWGMQLATCHLGMQTEPALLRGRPHHGD
jgi:hypothetical protein